MFSLIHASEVTPAQQDAVLALAESARAADGVEPLNEAAGFALRGQRAAEHWLAVAAPEAAQPTGTAGTAGDPRPVLGYAQLDAESRSAVLVVDPAHRRQGIGTALLRAVREAEPEASLWAFGNTEAARGLAAASGLQPVRELLLMRRDLRRLPVEPGADDAPPAGVRIDTFTADDLESLVAVNAAAFAHHPEQGALTDTDFLARMGEDWFDPQGLLLAHEVTDGRLLGFHWTKVESDPVLGTHGEVYAIGVAPDAGGLGIGRALLTAGLEHLQAQGVSSVVLYVEADAQRTVSMYRVAGFDEVTRDASYR